MRPRRPLAGMLALATLLLTGLAETLSTRHLAGWLGLALFPVAALVGVCAWLALGAPIRRDRISPRSAGR